MARRPSPHDLPGWLATLPSGVEADARWSEDAWTTMRFANGRVTQPHVELSALLSLRVRVDGRLASATTTEVSRAGFESVLAQATRLARAAPREPKFPGFPLGSDGSSGRASRSSARGVDPDAVGRMAAGALDAARRRVPDARVSGAVHVGRRRLVVANSSGLVRCSDRSASEASVQVENLAQVPATSGWAEGATPDPADLDTARLGRTAASRVAREPARALKPGAYPVVLRTPAVAELLSFLGYLGFNGHGELEGWSCLARQRHRRLFAPVINLADDPADPRLLRQPFDFEGVEKRARPLVEDGRPGDCVLDLVTAGRLGRTTTGHGPRPEAPWGDGGPSPAHLVLAPGDASEAELIGSVRRGVLVTRFHYVRVVDAARSVLTGMTRNGTYLIENGEVVAPVRNLRFTESIVKTLAGTHLLGRASDTLADERGEISLRCPALAARSFTFTSATLF